MFGISSSGKDSIILAVEKMFDSLAYKLLGSIPKLRDKKSLIFSTTPQKTLAHLFVQALNNREPNQFEKDVLKSLLNSSYGYVESLKNKTSSNVVEAIDSAVKQAKSRQETVSVEEISNVFSAEMDKARDQIKLIAEAETTKTRNVGHAMDISKVSSSLGDGDPTVFFVVVRDGTTCKECLRLHMMPDGVTPRLWKMSELKQGWHKRGEPMPSVCGLHPFCRCSIAYLAEGFGFKGGFVSYISPGFDAFADQRN